MKVASLFSGAGGLDLGFQLAGHEVIWANDVFASACETYRQNIGDHIICDKIENIPSSEIPEHDMLIGGFPCQGFSMANAKRGIEEDERNALYLEFLRVLKDKKPKFFLAENVKGILSFEKGKVFEMIVKDFAEAGYRVQYKLLNAANYGVPQTRERVFIVGIREDIDFEFSYPEPTHGAPSLFSNLKPWVTIGQALKDIPEPEEEHQLTNHTYSKFKLKFNGYLGNRAIDPNKPAPTVTARGDEKGGVVVLHHPKNHRRMSARELALTQSFPVDFEFAGNRSFIYRQIGNAVPPLLGFAVASCFPVEFHESKYGVDTCSLKAVS